MFVTFASFWPFFVVFIGRAFTPDLLDPVFSTVFVLSAALPFSFICRLFYDEKKEAISALIMRRKKRFLRL